MVLVIHGWASGMPVVWGSLVLHATWILLYSRGDRKGRRPAHTFADYFWVFAVVGTVNAFTFGQIGGDRDGEPNFTHQLQQDNWQLVLFAISAGALEVFGDALMLFAAAYLGVGVGPCIHTSVTIALATTLSWLIDERVERPYMIFPGIVFAVTAILLGAIASYSYEKDKADGCAHDEGASSGTMSTTPQPSDSGKRTVGQQGKSAAPAAIRPTVTLRQIYAVEEGRNTEVLQVPAKAESAQSAVSRAHGRQRHPLDSGTTGATSPSLPQSVEGGGRQESQPLDDHSISRIADGGSEGSGNEDEGIESCAASSQSDAQAAGKRHITLGLIAAVSGGALIGCFSPAFAVSLSDIFRLLPPNVATLTVFTAGFYNYLSLSIVGMTLAFFMFRFPPLQTKRSNIRTWLSDNNTRLTTILAAVVLCFAEEMMFLAGRALGFAASNGVQLYPMLSGAFGLLYLGEFRGCSRRTKRLLIVQYASYATGIGLLVGASVKMPLPELGE